jgi:AraC-like DNA-binding protein
MISPALTAALRDIEAKANFEDQVKAALRRAFAAGRSDVAIVARELGVSERTMQRRITAQGKTFRIVLNETRQELGRQLLSDDAIDVREVAFLLGYQDTSSFDRAFREWEHVTPRQWRMRNAGASNASSRKHGSGEAA